MSPPEPSPPAPANQSLAGPPTSLTNGLAARVLVSVAIVCLGAWVFWVYRELLLGPGNAAPSLTSTPDPVTHLLGPKMSDGAWQIQGLDWDVAVSQASSTDFAARWSAAPKQSTELGVAFDVPVDVLVRAWKPVIRKVEDTTVYEFERPGSRLQLWTRRQQGKDQLCTIRAAVNDADKWQLYELQPQPKKNAAKATDTAESWPVLPPKVNRICRRYDQERRILSELWTFDIPLRELVLNWENSGWRPLQTTDKLNPSPPGPKENSPALTMTLEKGSKQIYVWLQRTGPDQPTLAVLTRAAEISKPRSP